MQDFWSRPCRRVDILICSGSHGVQVFGDNSDAEIRNAYMGGVVDNVHEYIHLVGCQHHDKTRLRETTYTLEIPVNHIAGV